MEMDEQGVDTHLEAAYEERVSGHGDEPDDGSPSRPVRHLGRFEHGLESRALEGRTLAEVVTRTNVALRGLRGSGATILSVTYARQETVGLSGTSYLGAVLYRPEAAPDRPAPAGNTGRLLPFQRCDEAREPLALLAHTVSPETTKSLPRDERADALREQTAAAIGRLAGQLAEGHSAGFRAYLSFMGRFWEYSAHNALLIYLQRPTATRCAGMWLWNQLGYTVRRGERGLWIWAPMLRRSDDGGCGRRRQGAPDRLPAGGRLR